MRFQYILFSSVVLCVGVACVTLTPVRTTSLQYHVRLDSEEADAVLTILRKRLRKEEPAPADWQRLFASNGYQHLQERESNMGRAFSDSEFVAFIMSDTLLKRAAALDRTLQSLRHLDVATAMTRALKYLRPGTSLKATLYLEIKPRTNSFVFTGSDSTPSIFLYVDQGRMPTQLENTVAHELHHIGLASACPEKTFPHATPAQRTLLRFLGAFGEGQAMLAAAGSPSTHPHASDEDTVQARWDRDVARAPADIDELTRFFTSVLDGVVANPDSVQSKAFNYYGKQGPWYTIGWLMASTIEREFGRATLVRSLCEPIEFLALYNDAAKQAAAHGQKVPTWNPQLLTRLISLRRSAA